MTKEQQEQALRFLSAFANHGQCNWCKAGSYFSSGPVKEHVEGCSLHAFLDPLWEEVQEAFDAEPGKIVR